MRLSEWILIFIILFMGFSVVTFHTIDLDSQSTITETQYANMIAVACHDAAKTIPQENMESNSVWNKDYEKEYTVNTFYNTLAYCFNAEYTSVAPEIKMYTPVIVLIDNNGYYIAFNSAFDRYTTKWEDTADINAESMKETITISALNAWTTTYGGNKGFMVRYFLNNTVEITLPDGTVICDKKEVVIDKLKTLLEKGMIEEELLIKPLIIDDSGLNKYSIIDFLNNKDDVYEKEKYHFIVNNINTEVEFYINNHNLTVRGKDIQYHYEMPFISEEEWHRLLEHPTVISFLQGIQTPTHGQYYNIYAIGGGEYAAERKYYITEKHSGGKTLLTYHLLEGTCEDHTVTYEESSKSIPVKDIKKNAFLEIKDGYYLCDGEKILHIYTSMESCAELGAVPCECAINYN